MSVKTKVLFVAEAVTLAHVARSVALAQLLDPAHYEVHFAHCPRYRHLLGELSFTEHSLSSISPGQFMDALAQGKPLYDLPTLKAYVEDDLALMAVIQPDIVVGDFRLSLNVSAELAGIPYITISNACWSAYTRQRFTVPELPLTRVLGPTIGQWLFSLGRPFAFALHCLPMHRLRRHYGLKSLGFDLRKVYTQADYTLYADLPSLYDTRALPPNHRFIGPVIWSPALPLPKWWQQLPTNRPLVYVTLGSSGQAALLPELVAALGALEVTALVSTAGVEMQGEMPANVFWDTYLPGEEAVKLASLVVCNGGSPTSYQALACGVPVIGLAGNLDQYLNMAAVERAGAGRLVRAGTSTADSLVQVITATLADASVADTARNLSNRIADCNAGVEFSHLIDALSCGR